MYAKNSIHVETEENYSYIERILLTKIEKEYFNGKYS